MGLRLLGRLSFTRTITSRALTRWRTFLIRTSYFQPMIVPIPAPSPELAARASIGSVLIARLIIVTDVPTIYMCSQWGEAWRPEQGEINEKGRMEG
jgi:hypothetical protein